MNEKLLETSPKHSCLKAWRLVFYGFCTLLIAVIAAPNFVRAGGGTPLWAAGLFIIPLSLCALFFIRCPSRYVVAKGLAAMSLTNILGPRRLDRRNACIANLKQLEGAKANWALESHKTTNDTPVSRDLFGKDSYIFSEPKCPAGGVYTLGKVGVPPRCSIEGHSLD
jgi:hypothetical protein